MSADAKIDSPLRAMTVRRLVAEPWNVDAIEISGHRLLVSGWSMPLDLGNPPASGWFLVNGMPFDEIRYPQPRADVAQVFWQREGAAMSGFECAINDLRDVYPDGFLEIQRVNPETPPIERGRDSWFAPDPALHSELPDEDQRFRVIGDRSSNGFLVSGATDYNRLDRALKSISGKHLHEFGRVLDWGAGCGRLARYFPRLHADALTGCDIDHDNVRWCRSHLAGTFVATAAAPPLPFDDASFDLICGVSVFTHFGEAMQLQWLEELSRVAAPGAWLLMSIHGQTAIDSGRLSASEYQRVSEDVERKGIVVSGANPQLDGHADHGGAYVNVYHSRRYVRAAWNRYFCVKHILPGYLLHQDLVVMVKRR